MYARAYACVSACVRTCIPTTTCVYCPVLTKDGRADVKVTIWTISKLATLMSFSHQNPYLRVGVAF